jgi:hypothetical protein
MTTPGAPAPEESVAVAVTVCCDPTRFVADLGASVSEVAGPGPLGGSVKSSAVEVVAPHPQVGSISPVKPPARSTLPVGSNVAVPKRCGMDVLPAEIHRLDRGKYSSLSGKKPPDPVVPPVTRTFPSGSSVAVGNRRGRAIDAAGDHRPLPGS